MDNSECINNNIDNYAFYLFLFLVTLSMGNDFYFVLQNLQNTEFIKKQIEKYENYTQIFGNILCNNKKKKINKKEQEQEQEQEQKQNNEQNILNKNIENEVNKIIDIDKEKKIKKKIMKINKPIIENQIIHQDKKKSKYSNKILEDA
jgi:hypothetical protein